MRLAAAFVAASFCASIAAARASPPNLTAAIDAAVRTRTLAGAHVGILAVDATGGATLYARDPDGDFVPASTLKLIVGSAALARLGPDFSFITTVDASGPVAGGILHGDLYLRGGGDVQLTPGDLDAAAAAVAAAGIHQVAGALVADTTRYDAARYPPGWEIDDVPYGYAAVPGALGLDLNVAHLRVRPGDAPGAPASLDVDPASSTFRIENASITGPAGSDDTTDLARPWDRPDTIRVTGSYPMGAPPSDDLEPALPDPAAYAADIFQRALAARGVTVRDAIRYGATPADATVVWTHRSKPLPAILRDCWPPSVNVIAEQLLEELGAGSAASAPGDVRARGLAAELAWLQTLGVNAGAVTLVDGSGLSSYDRITPRVLVAALQADWRGPQRAAVLAALPVAGVSGTLQTKFANPPLRGNVYAKTGSMNHARLLAGYLRAKGGATVVFALMVNDWMDDSPHAESALDAFRATVLTALASE
ncbi:MAG TPA: D-alanyl-D-alanine carboxypeptidase/D-alanyl-D-alanine-endopeptidase [Candidatus Tumulicola sp.]|nr:D-alanyl-D-alanine carboxypeptidase/D-alanyl-D-alanine-endopeptidase [Candidatus Tumulicola sp.]